MRTNARQTDAYNVQHRGHACGEWDLNWRAFSNWAKHRPTTLRLADYLGRGRGRFRVLDLLHPPAPALHTPDLFGWHNRDLAACWIGHATVLLRLAGMNVLTDPVMMSKIG